MKDLILYILKIPAVLILVSVAACCFLPSQFMAISLAVIILILVCFIIALLTINLNDVDFDKIQHLHINGTVWDVLCVLHNADKNSELYQKIKIRMSLLKLDGKTLSKMMLDSIDIQYARISMKKDKMENKSKNKLIKAYNNLFTAEELTNNNWTLSELAREIEKRLLETM